MAEKEGAEAAALPEPRVIWSGNVLRLVGAGRLPCRVVLKYTACKEADEKLFRARPTAVYEVGDSRDAMNQIQYSQKGLQELPGEFFEAIAKKGD